MAEPTDAQSATNELRDSMKRVDAFMAELDGYMEYYCEGRIKESLGWMSPNEYRRSLGYV